MKTNQKYFALALAAVIVVTGASLGALSLAQTVAPLTCSGNASSVAVNQSETFTATGGTGVYAWSGPNLSVTNTGGSQFAVSYSSGGIYPITVTSGGATATCNMSVAGTVSTNPLTCLPSTQNVTIGEVANVSAMGGDGAFVWSSPDLAIANPTGSGFSANYSTTGVKTLTVTSGGLVTTCTVNVLTNDPGVVTPGLPNTGGGYGK